MSRLLLRSILSASLLAPMITGCGPAYADRMAVPQARPLIPIAVAPEAVRSPYQVEIISDQGDTLDTFFKKGRYYVHGANGEAYTIRISNPTAQRVEAVVSVDGLDVIDGESGDLRKRGYVVPAYGEVRIEGWRTSLDEVASFRFSSVGGSYAGKKGKARNVGVIAVALFSEEAPPAPPQIIIDEPPDQPYYDEDGEGYGDEVERYLDRKVPGQVAPTGAPGNVSVRGTHGNGGGKDKAAAPPADRVAAKRPAPPPQPTSIDDSATESGGGMGSASAPTTSVTVGGQIAPSEEPRRDDCCTQEKERLGLGTEYGEQRTSAASYTRFVRSSDRPVAVAELRYNDTAGLKALGILVDPEPDADEIMTRETADPFPGDRGFARPPAGIR